MKKLSTLAIAAIALSGISLSSLAQTPPPGPSMEQIKQQLLLQVRQDLEESCADKQLLACAGISKKTCITVTNDLLEQCFIKEFDASGFQLSESGQNDFQKRVEQCNTRVFKKHGLDQNKLESCSPEE